MVDRNLKAQRNCAEHGRVQDGRKPSWRAEPASRSMPSNITSAGKDELTVSRRRNFAPFSLPPGLSFQIRRFAAPYLSQIPTFSFPRLFPPPTARVGPVRQISNHLCGAMTRRGTPCQAKALPKTGRCKNHGGLSTGPKTPEGRARVIAAVKAAAAARRLVSRGEKALLGFQVRFRANTRARVMGSIIADKCGTPKGSKIERK